MIEIVITDADLAAAFGVSEEKYREAVARFAEKIAGEGSAAPQGQVLFRFTAGDSKSGTCAQCAPWIGTISDGTGEDGVPVPGLHPNCVCTLTPVFFDNLEARDDAKLTQFEWMEGLTRRELAAVVGKQRADLVFKRVITIRGLYDTDFKLIPIEDLPGR